KRPPPTGNLPSSFKLSPAKPSPPKPPPAKPSSSKHLESLDKQWNNWGKKRKQAPEPQPAWITPPPTRVRFIDLMVDIRVRGYSRVSTGDIKKDLRKADIKTKASENNKKYEHLQDYMKPFGISKHDLEPWVIPKYGSFFHSFCCGKGNFSTLDIGEFYIVAYLEIRKSPTVKDKGKRLNDGYISLMDKTIHYVTSNFYMKKSVV
ncbi:hypothetical protein BB558_007628, partial [Smittium angustum]